MKRNFIVSLIVLALVSGSVLAQTEVNYPSTQLHNNSSTADRNMTVVDSAILGAALGAAFFYEDHIKSLKEGENAHAGNDRIIFSAQFKNEAAFDEGKALGGSVRLAIRQCLDSKSVYERAYGEGACERIGEYAPGNHQVGLLRAHIKLWYFIVPASILALLVTGCTAGCVVKQKMA